jgi:hypothetical protein
MGIISAFAVYKMPYCTLGRAMDSWWWNLW